MPLKSSLPFPVRIIWIWTFPRSLLRSVKDDQANVNSSLFSTQWSLTIQVTSSSVVDKVVWSDLTWSKWYGIWFPTVYVFTLTLGRKLWSLWSRFHKRHRFVGLEMTLHTFEITTRERYCCSERDQYQGATWLLGLMTNLDLHSNRIRSH